MSQAIIIGTRPRSGHSATRPLARSTRDHLIDRHVAANFYPTPPEATRALLSVETFNGLIWEPACGEGHISRELARAGYAVHATDLNDWGTGIPGIDFLADDVMQRVWHDCAPPRPLNIITNPPYGSGLADAFVRRALAITRQTGGKVAMLLNLASLAHPSRTPRWKRLPPARIYAIDGVVCWPDPTKRPPRHFTEHRYAWCIWEPGHSGPPRFWWLSAGDFASPCDPDRHRDGEGRSAGPHLGLLPIGM